MASSENPVVLFDRPVGKVPSFTIAESSRILPGDAEQNYQRLKGARQRHLLHGRQHPGAGKTSPAFFGIDDLAAAVVLFAVFDFGITDKDLANYTSLACYAWDRKINPPIGDYGSPIAAALIGATRGQFWAFKLSTFHDDQTNARRVAAAVYDLDAPPPDASQYLPPSFLPRASLTIALPPLLLPLTRAWRKTDA